MSGCTRARAMGGAFLDARLRGATSTSSFTTAQSSALSRLESTVTEPTDTGLANQLQRFWAGWYDVANQPNDSAARQVLLGDAEALVSQISSGYRSVEAQWSQMRTETRTLSTEANTAAKAIAQLNEAIGSIHVSGGAPDQLVDQRNELVTTLSGLVGASARAREDGTVDVMIGGNALVRGVDANAVDLTGSFAMGPALAGADPVKLTWAASGKELELDGGQVASHLANLSGTGILGRAVTSWNDIATSLRTTVNTVHQAGFTLEDPAVTGVDFFTFASGRPTPPALGLSVALMGHPERVAAAGGGKGALDGSVADQIAQLVTATGGPDQRWRGLVVDLGVETRAAAQRATVADAGTSTARNLLSQASGGLDDESVDMLAYQRAHECAARVLTAIDEMLGVLINRTGAVGR